MSLVSRINSLATRIGDECSLLWSAVNGKEDSFSKNSAFNKNFGTGAGTVCEGDDSRLSDSRTPSDSSVSYAKIATDLTQRNSVSASDVDWNAGGVFTKTLSGAITFTF